MLKPNNAISSIGNTPLIKLSNIVPSDSANVWIKLEYVNPTGSYKDRMALAMIEGAEKRGDLKQGMTVVEYTGGSTGSSLAFICAVKGYTLHVISSNAFSNEKLATMKAFGAQLEIIESPSGKINSDLINKNKINKKISMTSPVTRTEKNGNMTMQFYLPSEYNKDSKHRYFTRVQS